MIQGEIEEKLRPPYWTASHFLFTPLNRVNKSPFTHAGA